MLPTWALHVTLICHITYKSRYGCIFHSSQLSTVQQKTTWANQTTQPNHCPRKKHLIMSSQTGWISDLLKERQTKQMVLQARLGDQQSPRSVMIVLPCLTCKVCLFLVFLPLWCSFSGWWVDLILFSSLSLLIWSHINFLWVGLQQELFNGLCIRDKLWTCSGC